MGADGETIEISAPNQDIYELVVRSRPVWLGFQGVFFDGQCICPLVIKPGAVRRLPDILLDPAQEQNKEKDSGMKSDLDEVVPRFSSSSIPELMVRVIDVSNLALPEYRSGDIKRCISGTLLHPDYHFGDVTKGLVRRISRHKSDDTSNLRKGVAGTLLHPEYHFGDVTKGIRRRITGGAPIVPSTPTTPKTPLTPS